MNKHKFMLHAHPNLQGYSILHVEVLDEELGNVIVVPLDDYGTRCMTSSGMYSVKCVPEWWLFDTREDAKEALENLLLGILKDVQSHKKFMLGSGPVSFYDKNDTLSYESYKARTKRKTTNDR